MWTPTKKNETLTWTTSIVANNFYLLLLYRRKFAPRVNYYHRQFQFLNIPIYIVPLTYEIHLRPCVLASVSSIQKQTSLSYTHQSSQSCKKFVRCEGLLKQFTTTRQISNLTRLVQLRSRQKGFCTQVWFDIVRTLRRHPSWDGKYRPVHQQNVPTKPKLYFQVSNQSQK